MEGSVAVEKKVGIKDLFKHRGFMVKLIAFCISRFGDSLDSIAYGLLVYQLTGSKLIMGTIFAVSAIPNILFSPIAGVYADRHYKKRILVLGYISRGIVVALTAALFAMKLLRPWHLFVFAFLNSTFESFVGPANASLNTMLVPKELYLASSSFSSSSTTFSELLGLVFAGPIIAIFKISGAILIDGLTFFVAALLISIIRIHEETSTNSTFSFKSYFDDLKIGISFIRYSKFISLVIILAALVNFFAAPLGVLQIPYVTEVLHGGAEALSFSGMGILVGMIIGGLLVGQFGSRFKTGTLVSVSIFFIGINYSLLSIPGTITIKYVSPVVLAVIIFFLLGISLSFANAPLGAFMMSNTPKELMGRVASVAGMLCMCMTPLGNFVSGAVAEVISIPMLLLSTGIIISLISLAVFLNKGFRNS